MVEAEKCRMKAKECLRVAKQAREPVTKAAGLGLAKTWLRLARQNSARRGGSHSPGGERRTSFGTL
jgi:hypothetical protein